MRPFIFAIDMAKKSPARAGDDCYDSDKRRWLIVFFVIKLNRRLILIRFQRQQIAAQVVDYLFSGIAEEGR